MFLTAWPKIFKEAVMSTDSKLGEWGDVEHWLA